MAENLEKKYKEIIKINRRLEEENKKLLESDRLKAKFMADMSHELRSPLNAIIGFSTILLEGLDGEVSRKQREDISFIRESGEKLMEHIDDLLDFSKIEVGTFKLNKESIAPGRLAEDVVKIIRATMNDKEIKLVHEIDNDLPLIFADRGSFRQIMFNLLSNAVKFTKKGAVIVKAHALKEVGAVKFSVADTGIGIRKKDRMAIFEPFIQIEGRGRRKNKGTGLGLAISKNFVEMHGGEIWFESRFGEGTTFHFTLPVGVMNAKTVMGNNISAEA